MKNYFHKERKRITDICLIIVTITHGHKDEIHCNKLF